MSRTGFFHLEGSILISPRRPTDRSFPTTANHFLLNVLKAARRRPARTLIIYLALLVFVTALLVFNPFFIPVKVADLYCARRWFVRLPLTGVFAFA